VLLSYCLSQSQSYVTTDGLSASLSWNKAPIWGLRPDLYCLSLFLHLLKTVFLRLSREHLIEVFGLSMSRKQHLRCAGNVSLRCCENNCLSSRYNGNASVRCLGNDVSELSPLFRLSGIPSQYIYKFTLRPLYKNDKNVSNAFWIELLWLDCNIWRVSGARICLVSFAALYFDSQYQRLWEPE
jgi:hypothetical protein